MNISTDVAHGATRARDNNSGGEDFSRNSNVIAKWLLELMDIIIFKHPRLSPSRPSERFLVFVCDRGNLLIC